MRQHKGWRQADLAAAAGVSQKAVSRAESGQLAELSFTTMERVAAAVGVRLVLVASWHGGAGDRLVDREHAAVVQALAAILGNEGWVIVAEHTFNHFGDRGSVDLLAWHEETATLLLIEVKTRLTDLQDLLARFATKVRVVPGLLASERGWRARRVGRVIAMPGTTANRSIVAAHADIFDASFPARAPQIRRWLRAPDGPLAGLWFLSSSQSTTGKRVLRVRAARDA